MLFFFKDQQIKVLSRQAKVKFLSSGKLGRSNQDLLIKSKTIDR